MRCEDAKAAWLEARYASGQQAPELQAHVQSCPTCGAFVAAQSGIEQALGSLQDVSAGPGFDTRFFARLDEQKRKGGTASKRRMWLWGLLPLTAAAAAMGLVWYQRSQDELVDAAVVAELELLEELPVLQALDEVEDFEVLAHVDMDELELVSKEGVP